MDINDRIYGKHKIAEPVLVKIINSPTFLRLKYLNQAGPSQYLFPWKNVSRFEHSIGVMLLLKSFKVSLEEQVAGLLHDITHTAFSHVADFVFSNTEHEYHELFHEQMIQGSEITGILKKYKISTSVTHPENFPLLERNIPDLCADRIDYALRDLMSIHKDRGNIKTKLSGLTVYKNEFVFNNLSGAESFANDYLFMDKASWANPREIAIYELMAQAILHAMEKNILSLSDLFTDDQKVMNILRVKGDPFIRKKLSYMTPKFRTEMANPDYYHLKVKTKIRYVDPKILIGKKLIRLSEVSNPFARKLKEHQTTGQKGWYLFIYPE